MSYSEDYANLLNELERTKALLSQLPKETLVIWKDRNNWKWLANTEHGKKLIPKKNREYAEQLAQRCYLSKKLARLEERKAAFEILLKKDYPEDELLNPDSPFCELLNPQTVKNDQTVHNLHKVNDFDKEYEHNPLHPEGLCNKTLCGVKVRSKSEAMIANELFRRGIDFKYECALHMEDRIYYPDFTIRRPGDGKQIYWEHFGIIDDGAYSDRVLAKIRDYIRHEIFPDIDLIMTFESRLVPLDIMKVKHVIEDHLE